MDRNGFTQPAPRPVPKTGKNAVEVRRCEIVQRRPGAVESVGSRAAVEWGRPDADGLYA